MRRFSFGLVLAALPAFLLSLTLAGCGGKDTGSSTSGGGGGGGGDKGGEQKQDMKALNPGKGVLKGKIVLKGSPNVEELTKNLKTEMAKKDADYCMKGSETETTQQAFRLGKDNVLGNVFVWVMPPDKDTFFKVEKKQLDDLDKEVKIHQPHCAFIPHCAFLFSQYRDDPKSKKLKPTGQVLKIANDATISHNTNWTGGSRNSGDNVLLGEGKDRTVDNLMPEAKEVTIKCNIHPWMDGYLRVVDTPYYDITKSDTLDGKCKVGKDDPRFGTYEIKGLPAAKVRVLVWHEKCGYLNSGEGKGEVIEILAGKDTEKNFEAKAP